MVASGFWKEVLVWLSDRNKVRRFVNCIWESGNALQTPRNSSFIINSSAHVRVHPIMSWILPGF